MRTLCLIAVLSLLFSGPGMTANCSAGCASPAASGSHCVLPGNHAMTMRQAGHRCCGHAGARAACSPCGTNTARAMLKSDGLPAVIAEHSALFVAVPLHSAVSQPARIATHPAEQSSRLIARDSGPSPQQLRI